MSETRYCFKLALTTEEVEAYFKLRHRIFCEEQALFSGSDVDELDDIAYPIVAIVPQTNEVVE